MAGKDYLGIPREKIHWEPTIDESSCIGCGECLETCPNDVFVFNDETQKAEVANPENCVVLCDKCTKFCSEDAISFPDKNKTKKFLSRMVNEQNKSDKR
ncbi:MAG: ferredoxin family protein [Actinomycetota bacterium]|nr:ferredoxin family protein [Actinomycetota bacterium]